MNGSSLCFRIRQEVACNYKATHWFVVAQEYQCRKRQEVACNYEKNKGF